MRCVGTEAAPMVAAPIKNLRFNNLRKISFHGRVMIWVLVEIIQRPENIFYVPFC
jgi:hypothetical protein